MDVCVFSFPMSFLPRTTNTLHQTYDTFNALDAYIAQIKPCVRLILSQACCKSYIGLQVLGVFPAPFSPQGLDDVRELLRLAHVCVNLIHLEVDDVGRYTRGNSSKAFRG